MSFALLFPGQGAQSAGFLHTLPENAAVRAVFAEASAWLGYDVLSLDSEEALRGTVAVQLGLLVAGCAFARFLAAQDAAPHCAAGMSVGAFAAAVAAGALTLEDALRLVKRRAELMDAAFPGGTHGLAVIEGLRRREVEALLAETALMLANENSLTQFVVAGEKRELEVVRARAMELGAHRAVLLRMSVPSHSEALRPAASALAEFAKDIQMRAPKFAVFSNQSARAITTADALRQDLVENMAAPVLWRDVMGAMQERCVTIFLEAPPGHTLTNLVQANLPDAQAFSAAETRWDVLLRAAARSTTT